MWLLDPTGKHILNEKIRGKLLGVPALLKIALISRGKLDSNFTPKVDEGWTLLRFRIGNILPEPFDTLDELLNALVAASDLPKGKASKTSKAKGSTNTRKTKARK